MKTPVLMLHGQPGLGADWDEVARLVVGCRVIAPDRPGYGSSRRPAASMSQNAELFASQLRKLKRPAIVACHSYGGGVGVLLAARHPELVKGLVLVASIGGEPSVNLFDRFLAVPLVGTSVSAAAMVTLGRVLPPLRRAGASASIRRLAGSLTDWIEVSLPDERYGEVASARHRGVWRSFAAEQRWLVSEIGDVKAALSQIKVPTTVIQGSWDLVVRPGDGARLAAAISRAKLVILARTGHFVLRDRPHEVAKQIQLLAQAH